MNSILTAVYVGSAKIQINPGTGLLLAGICLAAGFGAIQFLLGIVDFLKHPSRPRDRRVWGDSESEDSGLDSSSWGPWEWGDTASHSPGHFDSSCGDGGGHGGHDGCGDG